MRDAAYEIARQQDGFQESLFGAIVRGVRGMLEARARRRVALAQLSRLSDHMLRDVGLTQADIDLLTQGHPMSAIGRGDRDSRWTR